MSGYAVTSARLGIILPVVRETTRMKSIKTNNYRIKCGIYKDLLTIYTYILTSCVQALSINFLLLSTCVF